MGQVVERERRGGSQGTMNTKKRKRKEKREREREKEKEKRDFRVLKIRHWVCVCV